MIKYPMTFTILANSNQGINSTWKAQATNHEVTVAIPPEFEGPGGGFSPEDLYALALQNCFIATFKVFAEKSKLEFKQISTQGHLTVDRDESGRPWMSAMHIDVILSGVLKEEVALRILEKTSNSCMILNSVKTQKTFNFKVEV